MNKKKAINVFLVEDDEGHVKLIRRAFESSKSGAFNLTVAKTVWEARKVLAETTPDLAIIDYKLPDSEGTELLQSKNPYPTIVMTSKGDEEVAVASLKAGALDYFVKSEKMFNDMPRIAERVLREWENIHKRKQAEEKLLKSENLFRNYFELGQVGMAITSLDKKWLRMNDRICGILGYSKEELKKMTWLEITHPDDIEPDLVQFEKVLSGEIDRYEMDKRFIHKSGKIVCSHITVACQRNLDGTVDYIIASLQDITDRKHAEEKIRQAQKLESLGVLAGGIAHDFNNILTGILGNAEFALDHLSPASPARSFIEQIQIAGQRAAELSQEMLAYSGRSKFVIDNIDVNEIIKEMTHIIMASKSKKHNIKYDLTQNLPFVEVDIVQIRQVIMNLIINASEAISENTGVISITTGAMECDKDYFKKMYLQEDLIGGLYNFIEVADTGVGMDKGTIEKIFDPFFTTKFTGRGLGMSAVLGIIRSHKGAINIESEPAKGSKFTVFLPSSKKASPTSKLGKEETASSWRGSGTVLVVDDEKIVSDMGKRMLEAIGFNVVTACDGYEAIEIFRSRKDEIDCVLLDLTMPRMNGEESFLELRKIRKDIRVIMYSGYSCEETAQRFINLGVNAFLQKPFNFKTLKNKMRKVFESKGVKPAHGSHKSHEQA